MGFQSAPLTLNDGTTDIDFTWARQLFAADPQGLWVAESSPLTESLQMLIRHQTTKASVDRGVISLQFDVNVGTVDDPVYKRVVVSNTVAADPLVPVADVERGVKMLAALMSKSGYTDDVRRKYIQP